MFTFQLLYILNCCKMIYLYEYVYILIITLISCLYRTIIKWEWLHIIDLSFILCLKTHPYSYRYLGNVNWLFKYVVYKYIIWNVVVLCWVTMRTVLQVYKWIASHCLKCGISYLIVLQVRKSVIAREGI